MPYKNKEEEEKEIEKVLKKRNKDKEIVMTEEEKEIDNFNNPNEIYGDY